MDWSCKKINSEIDMYYGPFPKGQYKLLEEPFCKVCAHSGVTTDKCTWHHSIYGLQRIYAMGKYVPYPISAKEDLLSYHIWGFKKYQTRAYPLGKGLEVTVQTVYRELLESTVMVPVPLHTDKLNERGYNQSFELAKVIGDSLDITVREMLSKTRDVDMRALNWEERKEAVKGLYALQSSAVNDVSNQKMLLIDDVVTTGFTVSECAQVLKDAGADCVNVLAAGRTVI